MSAPSPDREHPALASTARRRVLDELRRSPTPLDATAIALLLGLHVTTARFHLDQLAAAGLVSRRARAEKRRGRPRLVYAPAGMARDEASRTRLIHVLAAALAGADDTGDRSVDAGRRWADGFGAAADVDAEDDEVARLVGVLDRVGFDPEPDGDSIRLLSCPFRDAAREHPQVVCSVHRGLIDGLLEPSGTRAQLVPFVQPELCLIVLDRQDVP